MEQHNSHSVLEQDQPIHVNNNAITAFLGLVLAVLLCVGFSNLAHSMHWHPVVAGILTGLSGTTMGAFGSSTSKGSLAAIFGWAGATNFVLGILMFTGLLRGILG